MYNGLIIIIEFIFIIFSSILYLLAIFDYKKFKESIRNSYDEYRDELTKENKLILKESINEMETSIIKTKDNNNEKELFNVFLKLRECIKENCTYTMNSIKACRIAIYLLHNGTYSTHGISFFKISCICEKIAIGSGVRERMIEHTNIPINLFDDMIDKIVTNDRYIVMNDENILKSNHKIFISAEKIYYSQLIAIYDINNNVLGFVLAEMDHPYSKDIADKEKKYLDELAGQLVPVLSYSNYTNKTIK